MVDTCLVTGTIVAPDGIPLRRTFVLFQRTPKLPFIADDASAFPAPVTVRTEADGSVSVDLIPGSYLVKPWYSGYEPFRIAVPDQPAVRLEDIQLADPLPPLNDAEQAVLDAREARNEAVAAKDEAESAAQEAVDTVADTAKKASNLSDLTNLKEARSNLGTFSTVADVQSRNIPAVLDSIRTNGYYTPGDGGGAQYYRKLAPEADWPGDQVSADGTRWGLESNGTINVRQLGAIADGDLAGNTGTDNTAAFNAATHWLRLTLAGSGEARFSTPVSIIIPPGFYRLENSWDLRDIRAPKFVDILGYGATLFGGQPGYPVVDNSDSRWVRHNGYSVVGHSQVVPRCGIQIGKTGIRNQGGGIIAIGNNQFNNITVQGNFELAPLLNAGCETSTFFGCYFIQREKGAHRYALVQTGAFYYSLTSEYTTVNTTKGELTSFTQNAFYGCQIRNEGSGPAMFTQGSSGHYYDQGCYFLAFDDAAVVLNTSDRRTYQLALHGHFESANSSDPELDGILYAVRIEGDGNTALSGFDFKAHSCHAKVSLIHFDGIGSSRLDGCSITALDWSTDASRQDAVLFSGDSSITYSGKINFQMASRMNLGFLNNLNGEVFTSSLEEVPNYPKGSYTIYDRASAKKLVVGEEVTGRPNASGATITDRISFTPNVNFSTPGDLSVSYAIQDAFIKRISGTLNYLEIRLRFTPTFTTAAGTFYISSLPEIGTLGSPSVCSLSVKDCNVPPPTGTTQYVGNIDAPFGADRVTIRLVRHPLRASGLSASHFTSGNEYDIHIAGFYETREGQYLWN